MNFTITGQQTKFEQRKFNYKNLISLQLNENLNFGFGKKKKKTYFSI